MVGALSHDRAFSSTEESDMLRIRSIVLPAVALVFTATCAPPPQPDPGTALVQPAADLAAVALGVAIDARDDRGAPRLVRAVLPRPAPAGMTPDAAARAHVAALAPLWIQHQQPSALATRGVQRLRGGASIVRLQQQVDGVDLHHGELHVMMHADGSLAAISGTVQAGSAGTSFRSTPIDALERALDVLYGPARDRPAITEGADQAGYRELIVADDPEFRVSSARARPGLLPDGDQRVAIWSVELFAEKSGADDAAEAAARRYLIGDADGRVFRDIDLTASDAFNYRVFADLTGNHRPLDGALDSFNPHPTGVPDHTVPPPAPYVLVAMEAFNGPHDPWLPANATTTTGNNVDAFADLVAPAGFGPGDIRPALSAGKTFDHRYDLAAEPLATATQSEAAVVNVFFVTNWLHDWYYDSGFTEATGDAQTDNFNRGGVAGDPLIAHAQANALGGSRDNANMTTPDDGLSPVMNMFLWSGAGTTVLTTLAGTPSSAVFVNGPRFFDLTGTVVLAQDRTGGTHRACTRVTNTVSGKIALIEFDNTCNSATAVNNLRSAGAIGVIAMIAIPGLGAQPLTGSTTANLPGLVIGFDDGRALEAALPATVTLHRTTTTEHDGDFDDAIISHEWGHYLHHRLASCEVGQCRAISEGWGDFVALHMMLRETDGRDGTFGVGLYALTAGGITASGFADPGYFGIRRFPYSTDRTRNGLSFRHISDGTALPDVPTNAGPAAGANSEVHNAGEVWATMLWDAYNVLIDQHGYTEARRRMSDYVVAGLLLTPPDATYTEARDALLVAAGELDSDDMILMAAAFAGRGAGTCAVSPDRASTTFAGVVESGTIAARLATSEVSLTDDGISCDHDGYLDPGESGVLHLTVANSGIIAADDVVITATTTTPGVTVGKPIAIASVAARSHVDLAIPVKLSTSAPVNSTMDISVRVDSNAGCNTRTLLVGLHPPIGVDEQAEFATTDHIETRLVAWTQTGEDGTRWSRATDPTGNHVLRGTEAPFTSDSQLVSPVLQVSATAPLLVTLQHAYDLAATQFAGVFFNGGVIEVSSDGGATWRDVTQVGVDPRYPGVISSDFLNPLGGRHVFGGKNPSFPARDPVALNFGTQFAGQAIQLRFRIGTSSCCPASGWQLDDIAVSGITNTPFPAYVAEPTKCGAGASAIAGDSGVVRVRSAPRYRLDGAPAAAGTP
jgi:large repetitive protein